MLGPAVAVIWGWGPALVWVVLGAVLVGCVHDLAALVLSTRARGLSVGAVAEGVVGPRARSLVPRRARRERGLVPVERWGGEQAPLAPKLKRTEVQPAQLL